MAESKHYDIVIVGAGIAGSALAVALSGAGFTLALVEAQPLVSEALPAAYDIEHFDPRVSALTPRSQAFLGSLDVWASIENYRCCSYGHMTVWDAQGTGSIEFDHSEVNAARLGYIVENRAIVKPLVEKLLAARDIDVYNPHSVEACNRLDADHMQIALDDGTTVVSQLLVAADGALSPIRSMLGFATREWDYGHQAMVATVEHERSHEHTAWQRFMPSGPLALLPLPAKGDRNYCSIVWSQQDDEAERLLALDDAAFCAALTGASEARLGQILAASKRFCFPLRQRHAVDYVQPGVALVADAAHTIHPLAGQGINLGLSDVATLAQELIEGHARGIAVGELALLQRYQRRRKGENLAMMTAMDGFKHLFEQDALPLRWLRNIGMRSINQMLPVKQQLMRQAMGLE